MANEINQNQSTDEVVVANTSTEAALEPATVTANATVEKLSNEKKPYVYKMSKFEKRETIMGYIFSLPVILGVLIFVYYPAIQSAVYSLYDFSGYTTFEFIGFKNFIDMFTYDRELTLKVFKNTFVYAIINVPVSLLLGYLVALLVNVKVKGISLFRTLFYMPTVIPGVASGILWKDIFDETYGIMNQIFSYVGIPRSGFFADPSTAMITLIMTGVWGVGGSMIIWLSAFKNIPGVLYESAKIDGASAVRRVLNITLPLSTSMIFYNLVTGVIGSLQVFSTFILAGNGGKGPDECLYFVAVKIYNDAFVDSRIGYACAVGWVQFAIIGLLTFVMFKSGGWVQYGED